MTDFGSETGAKGNIGFENLLRSKMTIREIMGSLPSVENDEYKKKAGRSPSSVPLFPPYTQAEGLNSFLDAADSAFRYIRNKPSRNILHVFLT